MKYLNFIFILASLFFLVKSDHNLTSIDTYYFGIDNEVLMELYDANTVRSIQLGDEIIPFILHKEKYVKFNLTAAQTNNTKYQLHFTIEDQYYHNYHKYIYIFSGYVYQSYISNVNENFTVNGIGIQSEYGHMKALNFDKRISVDLQCTPIKELYTWNCRFPPESIPFDTCFYIQYNAPYSILRHKTIEAIVYIEPKLSSVKLLGKSIIIMDIDYKCPGKTIRKGVSLDDEEFPGSLEKSSPLINNNLYHFQSDNPICATPTSTIKFSLMNDYEEQRVYDGKNAIRRVLKTILLYCDRTVIPELPTNVSQNELNNDSQNESTDDSQNKPSQNESTDDSQNEPTIKSLVNQLLSLMASKFLKWYNNLF